MPNFNEVGPQLAPGGYDLNDAAPQGDDRAERRERYVKTDDIKRAVRGRAADIVRAAGVQWHGRDHIHCPYSDHPDRDPSWRVMEDGTCVVCTCRGVHSVFDAIAALEGINFEQSKIRAAELLGLNDLIVDPNKPRDAEDEGVTVAKFCELKQLPEDFVRSADGESGAIFDLPPNLKYGRRRAIGIHYKDAQGFRRWMRIRVKRGGKKHTLTRKGDTGLPLYGSQWSKLLSSASHVTIVEGESDWLTLLYNSEPALGLPGATGWHEANHAALFDGVRVIYVVIEQDKGGEQVKKWLARSSIRDRVRLVTLPVKDPSDLWISCGADKDAFRAAWQVALAAAVPWNDAEHGSAAAANNSDDTPREPETVADIVRRFNPRYAVVNEAGRAVIYEPTIDPALRRAVLTRIMHPDFRKFYENKLLTVFVDGEPVTKSWAEWWLKSPQRREFLRGVIFDPTGNAPDGMWNLWTGFAVNPEPGDWSLLREHIELVICGGDKGHAEYLRNWIARCFQEPNRQAEVAIVLRGGKGCGKGILFRWIVRAWGQHGLQIANAKHLVGSFNAHLRDLVFLFADEAFFAGDKEHESVLKALVTEPTLPIEGKFQNVVTVPNMLHIGMASNSDWVVPASEDERRYFVRDVLSTRIGDYDYFGAIEAQMEAGGLAGMIHDMLNRDLSRFNVRNIPASAALTDQKQHSLDSIDRWWSECLARGFVWRSRFGAPVFDEWHAFVTTELLNASYLAWCAANRWGRPQHRVALGKRLATMYPPERPRSFAIVGEVEQLVTAPSDRVGNWLDRESVKRVEHQPGYNVGYLDRARAAFTRARGVPGEWDR